MADTILGGDPTVTETASPPPDTGESKPNEPAQQEADSQTHEPPTEQGKEGNETKEPAEKSGKKSEWPDGLLESMSAGDDKVKAMLARYKTPAAAAAALKSAQDKIRAGGAKQSYREDFTPAELTEWRKDNGVPETPDGYKIDDAGDLIIGDADKALIDDFIASTAHQQNMRPEQVKAAVSFMIGKQAEMITSRALADQEGYQSTVSSLRDEYGASVDVAIGAANAALQFLPEPLSQFLTSGRLTDGTKAQYNVDIVKWLASMADERGISGTVVPKAGGGSARSIQEQLAELRADPDYDRDSAKGRMLNDKALRLTEELMRMQRNGR